MEQIGITFINNAGVAMTANVRDTLRNSIIDQMERILNGEENLVVHLSKGDEHGFFVEVKSGLKYFDNQKIPQPRHELQPS